jgi:hypothetical protein
LLYPKLNISDVGFNTFGRYNGIDDERRESIRAVGWVLDTGFAEQVTAAVLDRAGAGEAGTVARGASATAPEATSAVACRGRPQ